MPVFEVELEQFTSASKHCEPFSTMSGVQSFVGMKQRWRLAVREWDNVGKDFCELYECFSRKLNQPSVIYMKRDQKSGYLRSYLTDLSR